MDEFAEKNMGEFDKTFNMLIDIRNKNFDWFDNPYIYPRIYELNNYTGEKDVKLSKDVKFKVCTEDEKLKFVTKS